MVPLHPSVKGSILILLVSLFSNIAGAQLKPALADSMLRFINANKNRASVYITKDDEVVCSLNENKLMPLASTVKIMVAAEFAIQSAKNVIDENSYVALAELDKYYIPNTDGGAHPAWLDYAKSNKLIKDDKVKLVDVARGMIIFSSNANTEYLMDLLGFDNIQENIGLFGLKQHTSIFPLVGSLFMYQLPKKTTEDKLIKSIRSLSDKKYSMEAYDYHIDLKEDSGTKQKYRPEEFSMKLQKLWSDRLPSSTTKEYVQVAQALNKREKLPEDAFFTIAEILEYPMENKAFQSVFKHYGVKGGSTGFVLTHVIYFTMKNGTRMELAIFFNDLNPEEEQKLEQWLDPFEAQIMFDAAFRERVKF
ncbi:MAG TPA: serine hydrolase [Ferruginibacter sp.]|nr:D-alanyl-D-alanine carboxypeptidase [Chitinophagaceae bacterium]HRI23828.1 serine hydrolase [Ferruginibacter sp.]